MKAGTDYVGVGVGALIFNENGEVFLIRREPKAKNEVGHWTIPGGTLEFNETMEECVRREVFEEIGVEIELDGQLPAIDHIIPDEGQHWVTNIFPARVLNGEPENLEPEKCDEIGWFPLDNLPTPLSKGLGKVFDSFLNIKN